MLVKNKEKWNGKVKIVPINLESEAKDGGKAALLIKDKKWD